MKSVNNKLLSKLYYKLYIKILGTTIYSETVLDYVENFLWTSDSWNWDSISDVIYENIDSR